MMPANFRVLGLRLLVLTLLFQVCRLVFGLCNPATFQGNGLMIFLAGMRYDLTALCILNAPLILLHLSPASVLKKRISSISSSILFIGVNALGILMNLIDTGWFEFTRRRSTSDVFRFIATGDDVSRNLGQYLFDFWYLFLIWLILLFVLVRSNRLIHKKLLKASGDTSFSWPVHLTSTLLTISLGVIGFRGGLQLKPLSIQSAALMVEAPAIPLVLNTPYTILKTIGDKSILKMDFMPVREAASIFDIRQEVQTESPDSTRLNVVVIILESFSAEFISAYSPARAHTPFFDSLMRNSACWPSCFANGKRSIEGIPAVLSAFPALMDEAFISSRFNVNCINSIASLLGRQGYQTAFFHGGSNGTMGFDHFTRLAGYTRYFGRNEYTGPESDNDGHWGIFDHAFFPFSVHEMSRMQEPFHAALFSLSSHHPYTIPESYAPRIPSGLEPVQASIAYTDIALREFFAEASKAPWFPHTLFVLTADHTGPAKSDYYNNRLGMYQVPLVFYHPSKLNARISRETAQQCDVLPSIMDYCGIQGAYVAFGKSLFRPGPRWAVNYVSNSWQLISDQALIQFDGEELTAMYSRKDSLLQLNLIPASAAGADSLSGLLKALLVQYSSGLHENRLCP